MAYYYGSRYLVTVDLLDERGSDGEPFIKNVKIIKKLWVVRQYKKAFMVICVGNDIEVGTNNS